MDDSHQLFLDKFCAFSIIGKNGEIIEVNNIFCELTAARMAEVIGQNYLQLICGAHETQFTDEIWNTVSAGKVWNGTISLRSNDGTINSLDTYIIPDLDKDKSVKRYLSYQILNANTQQQQGSIPDEFHLNNQSVESSKDLFFTLNPDGYFTSVSQSITRLLGYQVSEIIGKLIKTVVHPDDFLDFNKSILAAVNDGKQTAQLIRFRHKNDSYLHHKTNTLVTKIPPENHQIICGFSRDISAQEDVGQNFTDSLSLYHSLANNLPLSVWRKDREGRITYVNAALLKNIKLDEKELIGKTNYDLYPKEMADKFQLDDEQVMNNGLPFHSVESNIDLITGAPLYLETIKIPVRGRSGKIEGLQGIFWDITEIIESRKKLEAQNEQLTEIAWLHSHKVRGPVATIMGLMNIYDWDNPTNEANVDIVKKVDLVSRELDSIIHDVVKKTGDLYNGSEE